MYLMKYQWINPIFASRKGPVWNDAKVIGIQTIFWDITEQRLAENKLSEKNCVLPGSLQSRRIVPRVIFAKRVEIRANNAPLESRICF